MPTTHKTLQLRGYLTKAGYAQLDAVLAECAILYNAAIQEWRDAYKSAGVSVNIFHQNKEFTAVRAADTFWGDISTLVGRGVLRRAENARQAFYRRVKAGEKPGFPRFKSRRRWRTIHLAGAYCGMVKPGYLSIKGMPKIKFKDRGRLPPAEQIRSIAITRRGRRVDINLTYRISVEPLPSQGGIAVGIDMGVSDRMTLSTGESYGRRITDAEDIAEKQRRLARCRKGSREWRRRVRILANAHSKERVRNRNDCHQITTDIIRRFDVIAVEDLQLKNMTRSAKGTVEEPGTNVNAKSGLNREVLKQTWGLIRGQLAYKAEWAGRRLVAVAPHHTSQTCSGCGAVDPGNRSGKAFRCLACGLEMDADVNAAINIKKRGIIV